MNQVYLSGIASEVSVLTQKEEGAQHTQLMLSVQHKTAEGGKRVERYPVHMWNKIADWAATHVKPGDLLTVLGYLTNRSGIAVTAREIIIGQNKGEMLSNSEEHPPAVTDTNVDCK